MPTPFTCGSKRGIKNDVSKTTTAILMAVPLIVPQIANITQCIVAFAPFITFYGTQISNNFHHRAVVQHLKVVDVELLKNPGAVFLS